MDTKPSGAKSTPTKRSLGVDSLDRSYSTATTPVSSKANERASPKKTKISSERVNVRDSSVAFDPLALSMARSGNVNDSSLRPALRWNQPLPDILEPRPILETSTFTSAPTMYQQVARTQISTQSTSNPALSIYDPNLWFEQQQDNSGTGNPVTRGTTTTNEDNNSSPMGKGDDFGSNIF